MPIAWQQLGYVLFGGAVGSALRFLVTDFMAARFGREWPWGTLTVNLVGAFIAGLLMSWQAGKGASFAPLRPLLIVGLIGGLTTFSSLMVDVVSLMTAAKPFVACVYLAATVASGLLLVALGAALGQWLLQ